MFIRDEAFVFVAVAYINYTLPLKKICTLLSLIIVLILYTYYEFKDLNLLWQVIRSLKQFIVLFGVNTIVFFFIVYFTTYES